MLDMWAQFRRSEMITAWLSLDAADSSAKAVISYLVVSLLEAGVDLGPLAQMAEGGFAGFAPDRLCALVINSVLKQGQTIALFIDDYHSVESDEVNGLLRMLINKAPPCLKFIIGSRRSPNLGLASLRSRDELTEISQDHLRFTTAEIEQLFTHCNLKPDVSYLQLKTEGWAVALHLALIKQRQDASPHALAGFCGTTDQIANYLLEEVLQGLPSDQQEFLGLTSITERLNGDLANTLTGRADGWTMLSQLQRSGLPIVPLDDEQVWYRYHHLLGEFLAERLTRTDPGKIRMLHRAAAVWFAENGCIHESIRHARRSGNSQFALELIERQGGWRVLHQHGVSALQAFANLPERLEPTFALTALGQIMLKAIETHHREARLAFEQLKEAMQSSDHAGLSADLWDVDVALQCYEDACFDVPQVRATADALQTANVPMQIRVLALNLAVCAMTISGFTREAVARSDNLLDRNRALDIPYTELYVATYYGIANVRLGNLATARDVFQYIATEACSRFGSASNHLATGEILLGWVAEHMGDHEKAQSLVGPRLPNLGYGEGTADTFLAGFDVGIKLARRCRDQDAVHNILDQAERVAASRGLQRLALTATCWRVRQLALAGETDRAQMHAAAADLYKRIDETNAGSGWFLAEEAGLSLATLAIEDERPDDALTLIRQLTPFVAARGHQVRLLELTVLRAVALSMTGQSHSAREILNNSLVTAKHIHFDSLLDMQGTIAKGVVIDLMKSGENQWGFSQANSLAITPREHQILRALADGLSNKEAAAQLAVCEDTVKFHRRNLYRKLGVNTRSRLLARAREQGVLPVTA